MGAITLKNFRTTADVTMNTRLKDGGVSIDWAGLTNIKAWLFSDAQKAIAGRCDVSINQADSTLLVCEYSASKPQYLGVNRLIVQAKYQGRTKTYDVPAFNFVSRTAAATGTVTIDDPTVDVEIVVEDVSSSILDNIIAAALDAAARAEAAAQEAEHMVDIHTGPEGKSAYEVAVEEGYTGTEEEWLASLKGPVGETPDISIGTVTTVEPGTPAAASMTGTPEAPVLNLSIPKGLVGATPNFTVGTVTTGEPGSSVIVTITGTPEAPVLNLTIPQGMQGNTGSSVDYPYELVNNLTTNDATKGLSAAQGYVLDGKVSQLEAKVTDILSDYSLVQYANLFDKTAVTGGAAIRKDNGNLYSSTNDSYSDYIEVPSGVASLVMTPQTLGGVKGWAAYDSSKQFKHGAGTNVITFQEGDAYFRITVNTANLNTTMLVEGSSSSDLPSEYIPYGSAWERKPIPGSDLSDNSITTAKLADESVTKEKIGQSVWDEVAALTSEETSLPVDYTYSNYILAPASDGRDIIVLNGYDVIIFYVGKSKKFHITGTCANGYTGCALLEARFSGVTKLFNVTGGGYDYYGETTETKPYVAISVTHGTEFSCEVLEAVADAVKAIDERIQDVRPVIRIYKTDTEVEILTKLIAAYTNGNTDVIWENGTYVFAEVYQYMISELEWSWTMELPIGNNCRYYFNGSTLISNQPSGTYEESRNILGCKAGSSNKMDYELYDGILINNGGTYCVHDECARGTNPYIHKYVNMRMYYNKVEGLTLNISKCIGGGCGVNGTVIIDNCLFVSDATNVEVSWHGKQNEENPTYFALFVDGCYFGRGLAISSHFKATDKVFVKYSNNASRDALSVDSTPESEVYAFNNATHE